MHFKHNALASLASVALGTILALGFLAETKAAEQKDDATGTWTWTMPGRQGGPDRKMSLKLKADGEKLTGKLSAPSRGGEVRETEIQDGKVKGDEISFTVSREMNGNTIVTKYNGKVSADTIKGKVEFERNGEQMKRDWEAKRSTDAK